MKFFVEKQMSCLIYVYMKIKSLRKDIVIRCTVICRNYDLWWKKHNICWNIGIEFI